MNHTYILLISIISLIVGLFLLAIAYKYIEKQQKKEYGSAKEILVKNFKILLISIFPAILISISSFIGLAFFGMYITSIIFNIVNNKDNFIIGNIQAYLIIFISLVTITIIDNLLINMIFVNKNNKIYTIYHNFFSYFYSDEGGREYISNIYKVGFNFIVRIVVPLLFVAFIISFIII